MKTESSPLGDVGGRRNRQSSLPFLGEHPRLQGALVLFCMGAGTALSALALAGLLRGAGPDLGTLLVALLGAAIWLFGALFLAPTLRMVYAAVPFLIPIAGPPLFFLAFLAVLLSRRKDYLADDPMIEMIFNPPKVRSRRALYTMEEILSHDRKIVSAGDILRWGDISLKQALIDRLASREVTPRAIRILRGARNDPDDEVRLFATTILTRLEKKFQEQTRSLRESPDPVIPNATLGRSYLEYAESGLVGDRLARSLFLSGLSCYGAALSAGERLSREELLHVANVAASRQNKEVFVQAQERLASGGDPLDLKRLEWVNLYESGRFRELREDISGSQALWGGHPLPDYMAVWVGSSPGGAS